MSNTEETKSEAQTVAMDAEAAAQIGDKRKVEEEAVPESAGGEGDAQPPAKAQKTDADDAAATKQAAPAQEPVTIGYKTFETGKQAYDYFHKLMKDLRKYQNLNDYEHHMVHELIKKGHPDAARKLEGGVKAVQIREVEVANSVTSCFFLLHDDGSDEDVSYRKCLAGLFKDLKELASGNSTAQKRSSGGGGRGGRGRRGGGRGGRGGRGRR